jgi:hypothetical protein
MTTLRVGIASYKETKARTMEVARALELALTPLVLAVKSLGGHQFAHPQRGLGKRERAPAAGCCKRREEFERRRVRHRRPQIRSVARKPCHEQWHGHVLGLIAMIAVGAAIWPVAGNISQITRRQRRRTGNAFRRAGRRPVVDQYELHGGGRSHRTGREPFTRLSHNFRDVQLRRCYDARST